MYSSGNTPPSSVIVITGPTASGKSDIAVEYALSHRGEIISADSRQVYTHLTIGTGKITTEEMRGIPHHLLDIRTPSEYYNVTDFQRDATTLIKEIISRNNTPLICGGSSQWVSSLVEGFIFPPLIENEKRRKELEMMSLHELCNLLATLDSRRFMSIDTQNPRRLIRAIEIAEVYGHVPPLQKSDRQYMYKTYVLCPPLPILRERIKTRLITRFTHGMIEESEHLLKNDIITHNRMESLGLEYRWISRYLRGEIDLDTMKEKLFYDIWHYAKRQITWWKKKDAITWIDSSNRDIIEKFLKGD